MKNVVALDIPLSPRFVDAVQSCWDAGDAVFPIDQRWPAPLRSQMFEAIRPTHMLSANGDLSALRDGSAAEFDDALVIATSGSTGTPKGVVHTRSGLLASADSCHDRIGLSNAHWLACLPPSHIGGFAVIARSLLLGLPLSISEGTTAEQIERAARNGANYISVVPAMLERLVPAEFDVILLGGSKPPAVRPSNAIATYGSTETGSGVAYDGRLLRDVEIRIGDDEAILVRGPMLMRCYRDGTSPVTVDGWLDTGDAGALNSDGSLTVFGRRSEVIITGGENVWPDTVERILQSHQSVVQCAVFGVEDDKWGQRVCASVVVSTHVEPEELREYVAAQLPRYCAPHNIKFVDALPLTAGGKVDRRALTA